MKPLITLILAALLLVSCNTSPASVPAETTAGADTTKAASAEYPEETASDTAESTVSEDSSTDTLVLPPSYLLGTEEDTDPLEYPFDVALRWRGNCTVHKNEYHFLMEYLYYYNQFYGNNSRTEAIDQWRRQLPVERKESKCPCEAYNIVNAVRTFNIPREELEGFFRTVTPYISIDFDVIYKGTEGEVKEYFTPASDDFPPMNYDFMDMELKSACEVFRGIKDLIARELLFEEYFDRETPKMNGYMFDTPMDELLAVFPLRNGEENDSEEIIRNRRASFSYHTIAEIVKNGNVERTELEKIAATYKNIDLDKLYSNLDYYADLLGTEGYEYPWQVDALIIK